VLVRFERRPSQGPRPAQGGQPLPKLGPDLEFQVTDDIASEDMASTNPGSSSSCSSSSSEESRSVRGGERLDASSTTGRGTAAPTGAGERLGNTSNTRSVSQAKREPLQDEWWREWQAWNSFLPDPRLEDRVHTFEAWPSEESDYFVEVEQHGERIVRVVPQMIKARLVHL